jgi:two-component system, LytTR family, sensor kinase
MCVRPFILRGTGRARPPQWVPTHIHAPPRVAAAWVPRFLLQPLVENSILHAVSRTGTGTGEIAAATDAESRWLTLTVHDHGRPLPASVKRDRAGVGIGNTRGRLESLFGSERGLSVEHHPAGGTTVLIRLPYRNQPGVGSGPPDHT